MKVQAFVLVSGFGYEPIVSQQPFETQSGKWYKITADVPDFIESTEVRAESVELIAPRARIA